MKDDEDNISDEEFSGFLEVPRKRTKFSEGVEHQQWIEKYAPESSSDLCIHPRKLREVREALQSMIDKTSDYRLLVLTGPAGSSKSTSVQVLANELQRSGVVSLYEDNEKWIEYTDESPSGSSRVDSFSEFLQEVKVRNSVVIVEELPNVFHPPTLEAFRKALRQWIFTDVSVGLPPLVICLTDVEVQDEKHFNDYFGLDSNMTAETLLGKGILDLPQVKRIRFNPIAMTYLKKTTNKIINKERRVFSTVSKVSLSKFLDFMYELGDIRSLIANLQLWATLRNNDELFFSRENPLGLFHAIGKIIFSSSKFKDKGSDESDSLSIETVLENYLNVEGSLFSLALLENYSVYNGLEIPLSSAALIVDNLSIGDILGPLNRGPEVGVRSTRLELRQVQTSGKRQPSVRFPRHFKMLKESRRTSEAVRLYQLYVDRLRNSFEDLNLVYGSYLPSIYNSRKYRKLHNTENKNYYGRLGGKFKEIYADESAPMADNDEDFEQYNGDQFKTDILNNRKGLEESEDELSDPVLTDSEADDSLDELANELMPTKNKEDNNKHNDKHKHDEEMHDEDDSDMFSDPGIDLLISQGKI